MKYLSLLCMSVRIKFQFSRYDNKYSVYICMSHKFTYRCIYIYTLFSQPGLIMISIVMNHV